MTFRAWARLVAAISWLVLCFIGWLLARPMRRDGWWVAFFLRGVGRLLGLHVHVEGRPVARNVLMVANHISWLDILALGGPTSARFIAKAEIARWPLVGWLTRIGGGVFVSRERRGQTRAQADEIAAALRVGRPVALFAEGRTGDGIAVLPFRAALFASAIEADVPVQPVAIDYGPDRVRYAWPDGVSFGREARRMLNRRTRVPVTVRFLPPLDPARLDRKALASAAHAAVAGALA